MDISLTQLEYLVAVDTYRHFGQAAEKCLVTQPTLSMQIKKLEETLGVSIFDRSRQPVIPTDIGKIIVKQARLALMEARKLESLAKHWDKNISGILKVGIIPTLAPYLLPLFLGKMIRSNPSIQLHIREMMTGEIVKLLKSDELDVGILATPLQEEGITEAPLFYEEIRLYADSAHPLLNKTEITPDDLPTEEMWMLSEGNCFRSQVANLCPHARKENNETDTFRYESGSLETLKKLVDTEGGMTLLPELAILDLPVRKLRQVRSFANHQPLREVSLVYYRTAIKKPLIEVLQHHILQAVPIEMTDKSRGAVVDWR
jgi:LysR family transcriptional regulator, hydrogen peroxide-inducible genes activator